MKVGFVGLGSMGTGMAGRLLAAGHEVTVYNRSPERTRPLADRGARVAASVAEACTGEAVFTMLSDDAAVEAVVLGDGGGVRSLAPGAVHISSSTISPALVDRLDRSHAEAQQPFVAAPVAGLPPAAAAGQLVVMAAGAPPTIERVRPLLEAIGRKVVVVPGAPSHAAIVKLCNNFLIASVIESLGEAFALAGKAGLDRPSYLALLRSVLFDTPVFENYGSKIAQRAFAAPLAEKDLRLLLDAGEALRVPAPLAALLRDRYLTLLAHGGEHLDWSAIGVLAAWEAGEGGVLPA